MIYGVDVGDPQKTIDWSALRGSACQFAIIKATEGVGFTAATFARNRDEARRVGMPRGFYHFAFLLSNDPVAEADYFLSIVLPLQSGESLFLDQEQFSGPPAVAWCKAFLDRVKAKAGVAAPLYTTLSILGSADWSPVVAAGYGLWIANPDNDPTTVPATPWQTVAFKQYGTAPASPYAGISGAVDLDVFYGDLAQLTKYGYQGGTDMTPEQEAKLDALLAKADAILARQDEPMIWAARVQRSLDVETGKVFDEKVPPRDPRIAQ